MTTVRMSPILNEVYAIFADGAKPVNFVWLCEFLVNGVSYSPISVLNIDITRDYSKQYAEDITVTIQIPLSQYLDYIYPNRSNIKATLYQIPLREDGKEDWTAPRTAEVYRAMPVGAKDLKLNHAREYGTSADMDRIAGPVPVSFQLASLGLEQLRLFGVGGNYRNITPGGALYAAFDHASKQIKVDNTQVIQGVDMTPADNQNRRAVIPVPHGTMLIGLPRYLQEQQGGIYNSDIHFFLQGNHWYIWPKYGTRREERTKRVLTIFDIPANQFPGVERTYRETPGQVIIVSTGRSANQDNGETLDLNLGNGVRFSNADSLLDGGIVVGDNRAIARRAVAASEFIDAKRPTGMDFAPMAKERITANPFKMASRLAPRKGMTMTFTWENANPFLLYPGMPVKVYTLRDGALEERRGVLTFSQYFIVPKSQTIHDSQQVCGGALGVFVARDTVQDSQAAL